MSASREKKQRQGAGPSEREAQSQQKAAAYKRKVRTYTAIGVVVVVLVAALLIWDSGLIQRGQTAVTVGDTNYSVNDVNYYYYTLWNNAFSYYSYFGMAVPDGDDIMDKDSGQTYREYYLEQTMDTLTQLTALYDLAVENGYSDNAVAESVQKQVDSIKETASSYGYSYGAFLKVQYGRFMTAGALESILTKAAVANAYYTDYYDGLNITDEDIQNYYEENKDTLDTYEYSYLYFTPESVDSTDEDGNELSDEEVDELKAAALADAKEKAQHALDQYQDGTSIADLVKEYELTTSNSGDHMTNVGSSVSSAYRDELAGYENDQSGIYENGESGVYVLILHDRHLNEEATADIRHILISAETTKDEDGKVVAPTDEAWAAAEDKANEILAEYQAGEQTEDAFAALANKYSDDAGSNTTGGLYEGAYDGQFVTEFNDWVFDASRQSGDVDIVRHEAGEDDANPYYGYHIIYYVGENVPVWKHTSDTALRDEQAEAWGEEIQEGYTATAAGASHYVGN